MITPQTTAAILLAAGAAKRFGGDKLGAAIVNEATVGHAPALRTLGYEAVLNKDASRGLSTSIRAGVAWAQSNGMQGVLIALADMPFINATHYRRLFREAQANDEQIAFTACGDRRSPPALFGICWFELLQALSGESGARALLASVSVAAGVEAPAESLVDIDTPDDLLRGRD